MAARHVGKAADPHEPIRTPPIAELADDGHSSRFLRFNEMAVEQIDQHIPLTGFERVLPQLDHWTAAARGRDAGVHRNSDRAREQRSNQAHISSTVTHAWPAGTGQFGQIPPASWPSGLGWIEYSDRASWRGPDHGLVDVCVRIGPHAWAAARPADCGSTLGGHSARAASSRRSAARVTRAGETAERSSADGGHR